jgi:sugar phosphate isomerase/epimerase
MRWLVEFRPSKALGVALAPYHLPSEPPLLARLIEGLGDGLVHFYAWQHGMGSMKPLPKEQELMQMPGRGPMDFAPLLAALKKTGYAGWTSAFMHPVPRGIPILPTVAEVTAEIVRAHKYLEDCLAKA